MKAFRFALQPLLEARIRAEDACRAALAGAARDTSAQRVRSAEVRAEFGRLSATFGDAAASLPPAAIRDLLERLALLVDAVACAAARLERCCSAESRARDAFAAARHERRRLQALRDTARAAYARAVECRESALIEEANAARHNLATLLPPSLHN